MSRPSSTRSDADPACTDSSSRAADRVGRVRAPGGGWIRPMTSTACTRSTSAGWCWQAGAAAVHAHRGDRTELRRYECRSAVGATSSSSGRWYQSGAPAWGAASQPAQRERTVTPWPHRTRDWRAHPRGRHRRGGRPVRPDWSLRRPVQSRFLPSLYYLLQPGRRKSRAMCRGRSSEVAGFGSPNLAGRAITAWRCC